MLTNKLISDVLEQSPQNPVIFINHDNELVSGVVPAHVDDLYVTGTKAFVKEQSAKLESTFKMSKSGPLDTYLSLKFEHDPGGKVYLSQLAYINHVIDTLLPSNSKSARVP